MAKKEAKCAHCQEALCCPECGTDLYPALFDDKCLGYLCPKCMVEHSGMASFEGESEHNVKMTPMRDVVTKMDN